MKRFLMIVAGLGVYMIITGFSWFSTVEVEIPVTHPGEIDISKYTTIAIGDIGGNLGDVIADRLRASLVEGGYVKVIDHARLQEIMNEQRLSQSDLRDENSRLRLGKVLSAAAIISGSYSGDYKEDLSSSREKDKKGKSYIAYSREGKYTTSGNIEITDLETGQIIKSKILGNSADDSEYSEDEYPSEIDKNKLAGKCINKDIGNLRKTLFPWQEKVKVPFETDKALPNLEKGIGMVKMGNMEMAIAEFSKARKAGEGNSKVKGKSLAKAYWDMGLAYLYTWDFDQASECFVKAYSLDDDNKYIKANENMKKLQAEREILIRQGIVKAEK